MLIDFKIETQAHDICRTGLLRRPNIFVDITESNTREVLKISNAIAERLHTFPRK